MIQNYVLFAYYKQEGSSKRIGFKICIFVRSERLYVDTKILRYIFFKYGGGGGGVVGGYVCGRG